jgi:glucan 1,3-beta-glucosidase
MATARSDAKSWIRGVNIGGWLLLERFITPYFFALTSCHIAGNFCWYPGQIDAPPTNHPEYEVCDLYNCKPHLTDSLIHPGEQDYPVDEWTLASSFKDRSIARRYWEYHWENFVTRADLEAAQEAGVTHIRVPLPHWILGDVQDDEPYIVGGWLYFVRLVNWCRELDLQVWPDIHTAPGSQNGFDNSGHLLQGGETCHGWTNSEQNVQRSLTVVQSIAEAIVRDGLHDVVTGFGVLNEPFVDCDVSTVRHFNSQAYNIVRETLGKNAAIYIGDMFNATKWNDGWWLDPEAYSNTLLDSHYYHGMF